MRRLSTDELDSVMAAERYQKSREAYVSRKEQEGFVIVTPENNELLLDFDTSEQYKTFTDRFYRFSDEIEMNYGERPSVVVWPSSSGLPHRHAKVTLPGVMIVDSMSRIAMQALLGSDPIRELLSMFRVFQGDPCPSLLAVKPEDLEKAG